MPPVWHPYSLDLRWDNEIWITARISILHRVGVSYGGAVLGGRTIYAKITEIELPRTPASGRRLIIVGNKRRNIGEVETENCVSSCRPERSAWIPTIDGVNYHVHGRR